MIRLVTYLYKLCLVFSSCMTLWETPSVEFFAAHAVSAVLGCVTQAAPLIKHGPQTTILPTDFKVRIILTLNVMKTYSRVMFEQFSLYPNSTALSSVVNGIIWREQNTNSSLEVSSQDHTSDSLVYSKYIVDKETLFTHNKRVNIKIKLYPESLQNYYLQIYTVGECTAKYVW